VLPDALADVLVACLAADPSVRPAADAMRAALGAATRTVWGISTKQNIDAADVKLDKLLSGAGATCTVHRGTLWGVPVAIKNILIPNDEEFLGQLKQIKAERNAISELSHSHVVEVAGVSMDTEPPQLYMVMQLMEGGTLAAALFRWRTNGACTSMSLVFARAYARKREGVNVCARGFVRHARVKRCARSCRTAGADDPFGLRAASGVRPGVPARAQHHP